MKTVLLLGYQSDGTLYLAATKTTRTNVHMTNSIVHFHADALRIRQKNTICLAIRMADIVTTHSALAADFAYLTHNHHTSFWCAKFLNKRIITS